MVFAGAEAVDVEAEAVVAVAVRGKSRGDCQRGCCWWSLKFQMKEHCFGAEEVCTVLLADVLFHHVDHFGAVFHYC